MARAATRPRLLAGVAFLGLPNGLDSHFSYASAPSMIWAGHLLDRKGVGAPTVLALVALGVAMALAVTTNQIEDLVAMRLVAMIASSMPFDEIRGGDERITRVFS